jgi:hypothetical protein
MYWPRHADRQPDGDTLIADSTANRVIEVAPNGTVVWSTTAGDPSEAERLATAGESSNRPSERGAQVPAGGLDDRALLASRAVAPSKEFSAALFVSPCWTGLGELLALVVGVLALSFGVGVEATWLAGRRFSSGFDRRREGWIRWIYRNGTVAGMPLVRRPEFPVLDAETERDQSEQQHRRSDHHQRRL